jgi:hypothetical protein
MHEAANPRIMAIKTYKLVSNHATLAACSRSSRCAASQPRPFTSNAILQQHMKLL